MSAYESGSRHRSAGAAPAVTQPAPRELTLEEKARTAASIATNLEHAHGSVVSSLEKLWHAHDAHDVAAYREARKAAESAVQRVRELAVGAKARALETSDPAARAKLEQAEALAEIEERNLAAAPPAPAPVAPTLRMETALLSALPPLVIEGPVKAVFDTARRATQAVLRLLPFSDIQALELILREFPEHPIAIRFRKFQNPNALLSIIKDDKVRARSRAMEAAMPKAVAPPPAAFESSAPTLVAPPSAFLPTSEIASVESAAPATEHDAPKESPQEKARREAMLDVQALAYASELWAKGGGVGSEHHHHAFLNTLDRIADPDLRPKVAEKFKQLSGQSLDDFIKNASWAGKRDKQMALDLSSGERSAAERELAAMDPTKRGKLRTQASQWAQQVLAATTIADANDDANAQKIARVLGPRSPVEIEAIRAAIRSNTNNEHSLYEQVDRSLSGGNEDQAVAGMGGNPLYAALVGLRHAEGDSERVKEILRGLDATQIAAIKTQVAIQGNWIVNLVPEGADRDEVRALIEGNRGAADAARIGHLLKRPKDGARINAGELGLDEQSKRNMEERKAENVIKELEGKSPSELRAARDAWNTAHPTGPTFEAMLDERFGEGHSVDKLRIGALLNGDRVTNKVLQLREGMRAHDQQQIEDALASPNRTSSDPVKRLAAESEHVAIAAKVKELDAKEQRWSAVASGRPTDGIQGRDVEQQVGASYLDAVDDPRLANGLIDRMTIEVAPELGRDKREDDGRERRAAAGELVRDGKLSAETQVYRADKKGDEQTEAQILENIDSGEFEKTKARYRERYGKEMIAEPKLAKYRYLAEVAKRDGDKRPLEEIELELARRHMNANEQRIDNVGRYGVKADRSADTQYRLQNELNDKQHSNSLEYAETVRSLTGGNIGTQELAREQLAAEDNMFGPANGTGGYGRRDLKPGVDRSEFDEHDRNLTSTLETQRDEKLKLANHVSKIFMTIVKLAAFAAGQPHIVAWIDILGGMANIAIKKQIAGEAYDPADDAKLLAITAAVDIATVGIARYGAKEGEQALAAVGSDGWKHSANLAVASAGIVASGIVEGRTPAEILGDVVKGGLTQYLPQKVRDEVMRAIGNSSRARVVLAEIAGMAAEIKTNATINGGDSITDAVVMTLGTRLHAYLSTLPSSSSRAPSGEKEGPNREFREIPETTEEAAARRADGKLKTGERTFEEDGQREPRRPLVEEDRQRRVAEVLPEKRAAVDNDRPPSRVDSNDPKTRSREGKQTEKPDKEGIEEAITRRSEPLKPMSGSDEHWAKPADRKGVPEDVPLTAQEVRDVVAAKYKDTVDKYANNKEHTANPKYLEVMEKFRKLGPEGARTKEGKDLVEKYMAELDAISKEVADSGHDADAELRMLYNVVEQDLMKQEWLPRIGHLPLEQRAQLAHMWREEWKLMVRDLMTDMNQKEALYLRDLTLSGDRRGRRFADLHDDKRKKHDLEPAEAYQATIASAFKSNEDVNLKKTGYANGIDPEAAKDMRERAAARDTTTELANVRAENSTAIERERASKRPKVSETTPKVGGNDEAATGAVRQESNEARRAEIHLADDKPARLQLTPEAQTLRGELDALHDLRRKLADAKRANAPAEELALMSDDIAGHQRTLDAKLRDPKNKEHLLDPSVVFALAREANSPGSSKDLKAFLSTNIDAVTAAQAQSRQGTDPLLRAKREVFEREIAIAVLNNGPVKEAVDRNLQMMCDKAKAYIEKSRPPGAEREEAFAMLGAEASSGYAGAVMTEAAPNKKQPRNEAANKANAATMLEVLENGNARERMIAIGKFAELVASDAQNDPGRVAAASKPRGDLEPGGVDFTVADAKAFEARLEQYNNDRGYDRTDPSRKAPDTKDFLKPVSNELGPDGKQTAYQKAKQQDMDTKQPGVFTRDAEDRLGRHLTQQEASDSATGTTKGGEASPLARTTMTIEEAQAMGLNLSPREIKAAKEGKLPWIVGTKANIVDPQTTFIRTGTQASMPQKAGISGTTFRFMEASALLGGDPVQSRLAMVGALQAIDAHTFYEIANAAAGFGLPYNPNNPYANLLPDPILQALAKKSGSTLDELNGTARSADVTPGPQTRQ